MTEIKSSDDLLVHLALNGDPSAFYTLIAPFAHDSYINLRCSGKDHRDTMAVLVKFLKKLYYHFPKESQGVSFGTWYELHRKKYLGSAAHADQATHVDLETIPASDISHLNSQIRVLFQRNYGHVRKRMQKSIIDIWFHALKTHSWSLWVMSIILVTAIGAGILYFMSTHDMQLTLSLSTPQTTRTVSLPAFVQNREDKKPVQSAPLLIAKQPDSTKSIDSSKNVKQDSLPKPIPVKKRYSPPPVVNPALIDQPIAPGTPSAVTPKPQPVPAKPVATQTPVLGTPQVPSVSSPTPIQAQPQIIKPQPKPAMDTLSRLP